jgi:hypothetical protein
MKTFWIFVALAAISQSATGGTVNFADPANGDYTLLGATAVDIDGVLYDYVVEDTTLAAIIDSPIDFATRERVFSWMDARSCQQHGSTA